MLSAVNAAEAIAKPFPTSSGGITYSIQIYQFFHEQSGS